MRVAINGFGRIGRAVFKICLDKGINVVAINDLHGVEDAAYLLMHDSVYGKYNKKVDSGKDFLKVNGKKVMVLGEPDPEKLPWNNLGVDVVVESTGVFTKKEEASKHLQAGAKYVLISAPAKDEVDLVLVPGVNQHELKKSSKVISVASCTTNALAPVVKVLEDKFGIKQGIMTTIHAYTATQNIVDGSHKKKRRGRAAAVNIVPTTTGASEAVCQAFPKVKGKITGMAMRVPVPSGSIVDLTVELKKKADVEKVNKALEKAAQKEMKGILGYTEDEIVSSDIIGDPHSSIVDGLSTMKVGNLFKILTWYDNEYGYSNRVVDTLDILKKWVK
jgi:glyceraldehyde 3-phosphate dehydrogenase